MLCPAFLNSHWTRRPIAEPAHLRASESEPEPPPVHYPVYLREQAPLPLRVAKPVLRGPSPANPFPQPIEVAEAPKEAIKPEPSEEDLIVRTLTGSSSSSPDPFDIDPMTGLPNDLTPPDLGQMVLTPESEQAVETTTPPPRRLLLETSLPRARVEETIPAFELPVGNGGATLRLPIAPTTRRNDLVPPPSSATYRSE